MLRTVPAACSTPPPGSGSSPRCPGRPGGRPRFVLADSTGAPVTVSSTGSQAAIAPRAFPLRRSPPSPRRRRARRPPAVGRAPAPRDRSPKVRAPRPATIMSRQYVCAHGRAARRRRPRVELVPPRRVHRGRRLVEAHRRDLRGGAHRRGPGRDGRAGRGAAWRARRRRSRSSRTSAAASGSSPSDVDAGRDERDPRRRRTPASSSTRARGGERPARPRALARGGGPLRLPGGGQLDDAGRRRRARPRRRLDAARARRRAATRASSTPGRWARCA